MEAYLQGSNNYMKLNKLKELNKYPSKAQCATYYGPTLKKLRVGQDHNEEQATYLGNSQWKLSCTQTKWT